MSLTPEWRRRVERWRETLPKMWYQPLGTVPLKFFQTKEHLKSEDATRRPFKAIRPGTAWGKEWLYGWFSGSVKLPRQAAGRRIVLKPELGGDAVIWVDGQEVGERDHQHTEITLHPRAKAGQTFSLLMEAYAGHRFFDDAGPQPVCADMGRNPHYATAVFGGCGFGIWEEEVFQAWLDMETLVQLRENIPPESLRLAEIDKGLREFTVLADLELPREQMLATLKKARTRLKPLLALHNSPTTPELHCFGHSHIDVEWLWPLAETQRKIARTFSTQLQLMQEYPEFRFLQSQAQLYAYTKQLYPDLYRRIQAAAKQGRWIVEGGMWVEADTNVTGGESLIRQFLHGKKFFQDEFGVESRMLWLPDVFGYSGALPQIMRGCGVEYFSTSKIFWNYNGGEAFPYNTFWWQGIDGTRVLSHLYTNYNSRTDPQSLIHHWNHRAQKDGIHGRMVPFGWGDGGGGVTRRHLEFMRRCRDLEGMPKALMSGPVEFFKAEERRGADLPAYVGELYFQAHRGTYTTQARTKRGNRKGELALREAEMWGAAALGVAGFSYPAQEMDRAWKSLLLAQFHDILPGSSIARVYHETEADLAKARQAAEKAAQKAMAAITHGKGAGLTVFNSLSWPRPVLAALPRGWAGAVDPEGLPLPVQRVNGRPHALVEAVPSCGWTTLKKGPAARVKNSLIAGKGLLENEYLRLTFNASGEITGIRDKQTGSELAEGACNSFRMYRDVPGTADAWDLDSHYKCSPVRLDARARVEVSGRGPLFASLKVTRKLNQSLMTQEIRLAAGSRRVDFITRIDWKERHKVLKVNFATDIKAEEALHEIQFGHIRRPNHASRQFDQDRFEVCNQKWTALAEENRGCAVLNDCKYGVNVEGGSINLTLLRSPLSPDEHADQGIQEFTYAFFAWKGSLAQSGLVQEAYDLNVPAQVAKGEGGRMSLLSLDAPNIVVEAVKPAEDQSGHLVVRLYESLRCTTACVLKTGLPLKAAWATDMLEKNRRPLKTMGNAIPLNFRPFEIKTLRLKI